MPIPITDEQFANTSDGAVFALGETTDDEYGLNMTRSGKKLRWVAKKGWANDWAMYAHWDWHDYEFIIEQGDKVCSEENIRRVLNISDQLMRRYRW